ncbi:MAG TPA: thiolase family protein [Solirubrobacteraceae bacterium]|jgi:acetyl-CoA acetyltransferase|nr:thiolase family protein [Solirubrobacteraceae bacterium]
MERPLAELRRVYVVGAGLHPYQRVSETPYLALGVRAVREALADAGITWNEIEAAYTGTAVMPMATSRLMYRHLGATGIPTVQVENASASGSSAFRQACLDVAAGHHDIVLACGVDKPLNVTSPHSATGVTDLVGRLVFPAVHFALLANRFMHDHRIGPEQLASVAVKNHANGARNPNAQRQKERTLQEIVEADPVVSPFTRLQCCPVGEGAAAVVVASEEAIKRAGLDRSRAIAVLSSVARSERDYGTENPDAALTREVVSSALRDAGREPRDLDVVELHDAFTIEELLYVEAMGLCDPGESAAELQRGAFHIGGRVAVNPSGGLLAMGHPIGPTGVGQICEIATQLRGEAGERQHGGARVGLAHMVGVGAVCVAHVLAVDGA